MAVYYDPVVHFIGPNTTLGWQWRYGNEAYHGPNVIGAAPEALDQALNGSIGHVRFTARNPDGLTSRCFYHYTVTNGAGFGVSYRAHALSD
ncbi:hypothetical protein ACFW7J_26410 [Streptomyces sp. NPDC059525]|uniref:hypothetical protein n=1 Tax=Streptomyces sp. NPDC059525 TaxID=3346857 RepID=UPI0036866FBE